MTLRKVKLTISSYIYIHIFGKYWKENTNKQNDVGTQFIFCYEGVFIASYCIQDVA